MPRISRLTLKHPPLQPRIGLALSGGAARGIAHIGVLRAFAEHQIKIDCVAGTSAGSLVGGALASGLPLSEIEEIAVKLRWRDVGRMTVSRLGVQSNERMEAYLRATSYYSENPGNFPHAMQCAAAGMAVLA